MIRIINSKELSREDILKREMAMPDVTAPVAEILADVRQNGDAALKAYCRKFEGAAPTFFEVTEAEKQAAISRIEPEFMAVLTEAAENIRAYHRLQIKTGYVINREDGVILGQKVTPLESVGLYVPGGTASYPSTVLMNGIPAKLAGVGKIIMVTPPDKNGEVSPNIIAAAALAGVDRIFKCGGAQAIAALAYGTESVPCVDKIVGPGNVYVAEAKRQVFGKVAIDMIAGPSEILVIADGKSNPVVVAADMLSQAEHDKLATAVLITESPELAKAVAAELDRQLKTLPREEIARASIENNGKIIVVSSVAEAIEISNSIAPEHLEICVDEPMCYLDKITHAGSIFLGRSCPEPLGDYFAGTNHTLPTSGTARFSSPLSVEDFVKKSSYMYYPQAALDAVSEKIACFAEKEGLHAHAVSALIRSKC